ncbi:MAG: hypothetical protein U0521_04735 [Anaerolineae bacterium]
MIAPEELRQFPLFRTIDASALTALAGAMLRRRFLAVGAVPPG